MLGVLGPGLISANAGNDAGGIATYSSVGAAYGYSLLWALALITVSLAIVQEMAGRLGAVTGKGYADVVRENFGLRATVLVMLALLVANGGLMVSEFAAIGAASELFGVPRYLVVPPMAFLLWWLITRGSYTRVERVFLAMTFVFFAYPVAAFLAHPDWADVGHQLVRPSVQLNAGYLTLFIAMVGTTITPYMQIYLQSAVAERGRRIDLAEVRLDAYGGSLFADLIAGFIIIATGATLFVAGRHVETAADAARALGPLAGRYATYLFGAGLFGASMLAAGVLPLATSYTVTEAFGFEKGQTKTFQEAPVFLGLFTGLVVLGAAIALLPINVIKLLIGMQVLNGLLLPVVLVSLVRLTNDPELMGEHRNGRVVNVIAWLTVGFVVALSTTYLVITILGLFGIGPGG
jgi:NRAMP (natural resistance-associated macrophage protein)-like metal ion transporter